MLHLNQIDIGYPQKTVLRNCNFSFNTQGLYIILGNNGSGNTTLLKSIAGILPLKKGDIQYLNNAIICLPLAAKSALVQYMDHPFPMPGFMTVEQYLKLGLKEDITQYNQALKALKLANLSQKWVNSLSRGQQQKTMLAKAIYAQRPITLLDEPTNYLDYPSIQNFWDSIAEMAEENLVIATVHNPEEAIKSNAEILVIQNQQLLSLGKKPNIVALISKLN